LLDGESEQVQVDLFLPECLPAVPVLSDFIDTLEDKLSCHLRRLSGVCLRRCRDNAKASQYPDPKRCD
jgi:hypothetical protein